MQLRELMQHRDALQGRHEETEQMTAFLQKERDEARALSEELRLEKEKLLASVQEATLAKLEAQALAKAREQARHCREGTATQTQWPGHVGVGASAATFLLTTCLLPAGNRRYSPKRDAESRGVAQAERLVARARCLTSSTATRP